VCGITGTFQYGRSEGSVSAELLVRMRETLHHRGPDGEGLFLSPDRRVGFGHRRLAIIDPAGGKQPMLAPDGTCVVFNGEIYNYPELRKALDATGIKFDTRCDTEVILHLYRRYGERCVDHLTGMFAFAVWDPMHGRIFFARDPVGEKPLFWADHSGEFLFASEIKALLEHPVVPREVNHDAIGPYLANLTTPGPETLFRGINKLGPGCCGVCDAQGVRISRYSYLARTRHWDGHNGHSSEHVRSLLDESVRMRLMSDVPVGVLLSGGMDSTTIVALLRDQAHELASFTVGFPGVDMHDEREEARWVARRFGTKHHEVVLHEQDALDILGPLIYHADEPIADPVCVPLFAVCRLAREAGIKVVLAGEGADELFWGYHEYRATVERWRRFQAILALPKALRQLAAAATSPTRRPRRRELLEGISSGRARPVHMPVGLTGYQRARLMCSGASGPGWAPGNASSGEDALTTFGFDTQEYEFGVRLPELLLMRIDRFSMANSVEARVPFLDPSLINYVYQLPLDQKIRGGITKFVLKQAVSDVVPDRVALRPKQGFAAPTAQWFAGRHGNLLCSLMNQDALRRYFNASYLSHLVSAGGVNPWDTGRILWPILNFGLWHKQWIEGESLDDLVAHVGGTVAD
jgi:asparagine synthase (glutamine-hydrolysing)